MISAGYGALDGADARLNPNADGKPALVSKNIPYMEGEGEGGSLAGEFPQNIT